MKNLERILESTLLHPSAAEESIIELCRSALKYNFFGVCVNPCRVALADSLLAGSQTFPVTVVGFPLGAAETAVKQLEAQRAIENGAREIDMVLNIGALKDRNLEFLRAEMSALVSLGVPVKLIIETGLLNPLEIGTAVECAADCGVSYIKTSTGYGPRGASLEDIALLRSLLPAGMGIKASGGIKNLEQALALGRAGADRLGTSSAETIYLQYLESGVGE